MMNTRPRVKEDVQGGEREPGQMDEAQAWLGSAAASYYRAWLARHASRTSLFDQGMLELFKSIEVGADGIDQKIEDLHQTWRHENVWQQMLDRAKLDIVYAAMTRRLARRASMPGVVQMQENWTRLLRVGNKRWGAKEEMAASWVAQDGTVQDIIQG